jgi:uncharacterized membrane protein YhiD involved in acid resistance
MMQTLLNEATAIGLPVLQAIGLGLAFTLLPGRLKNLRQTRKGRELLKAQVLVTMAGALLVVVIGDDEGASARAFGLLGLGSFVRFRSALKSPADTAMLFLLIGIGMACGVGRPLAGVLGAVCLMMVVSLMERFSPSAKSPIDDREND